MILRLSLLLALVLSFSTVAAAQAVAEDQALAEAKRHFEGGRNSYTAGDYQGAIREFKAAEALRPSPVLSYNIGLANEKLGKRSVALKYYRRYLEGQPNAPNRAEVEGRIAQMERELAAKPQQAADRPTDLPPEPPPPPQYGNQNTPPPPTAQGYDPYAAQPGAMPVGQRPATKKRNLWWVWMLVGIGSAAFLALIIGVSVYAVRHSEDVVYSSLHQPASGTTFGGYHGGAGGSFGSAPSSSPAGLHRAPDTVGVTVHF